MKLLKQTLQTNQNSEGYRIVNWKLDMNYSICISSVIEHKTVSLLYLMLWTSKESSSIGCLLLSWLCGRGFRM